jgi:AAA domain
MTADDDAPGLAPRDADGRWNPDHSKAKYQAALAAEPAGSWGQTQAGADAHNRDAIRDELAPTSTWVAVDWGPILDDDAPDNRPTVLTRTDGHALLYRGRVNSLIGEPESSKSWIALVATAEQVALGSHVLIIDFEDVAATTRDRLRDLGITDTQISALIHFVQPTEPITAGTSQADIDAIVTEHRPVLIIIDGVTEAMAMHGLDLRDNNDIVAFLDLLARPLARTGACVVMLDHVVKASGERGKWAIGGQAKIAGVDGAVIRLEVVKAFGRGRDGLVVAKISKDRVGHLRAIAVGKDRIALMRFTADPDGGLAIDIEAPEDTTGADGQWRPTFLMERVSRALEASFEPMNRQEALDAVKGNTNQKGAALAALIAEECVTVETVGRERLHKSVKQFRQADDKQNT